jgi:murein DD-endopeptidase MepM/ murein hydrolase activator NlpD
MRKLIALTASSLIGSFALSADRLLEVQVPVLCVDEKCVWAECSGLLFFPIAPTNTKKTFVRDGFGRFGAPRKNDQGQTVPHAGVDILPRLSDTDQRTYAVTAVASGKVAYAQVNGTERTGYGNVVIIDHGNNCYSFYAHWQRSPSRQKRSAAIYCVKSASLLTAET